MACGQNVRMSGHASSSTPATITPYRDGPLIVRGNFEITDIDGRVVDSDRTTVALCRCGRSALKPFCDGSHRLTGFHAPSGDARAARDRPVRDDETPRSSTS
jgi:CDGSH-type Zn-finger protein